MPASDVTISASFEAAKKETADAETEKRETEEVKEEAKHLPNFHQTSKKAVYKNMVLKK